MNTGTAYAVPVFKIYQSSILSNYGNPSAIQQTEAFMLVFHLVRIVGGTILFAASLISFSKQIKKAGSFIGKNQKKK